MSGLKIFMEEYPVKLFADLEQSKTKSKFINNVILLFFPFYIVTGNLFRIFRISDLDNNILITEIILYCFSFAYVLSRSALSIPLLCGVFTSVIFFFSAFYGILTNGFDWRSILYAPRAAAMVMTGIVLGHVIFERFKMNIETFIRKLVSIYSIACLLGLLIFICFPSTKDFWMLLNYFGIVFQGDPHINRYVSVYFDPNFYAALAGLPLLLSWTLYEISKKKWDFFIFLFFFFSIIFTWSRSGIVANILLLMCMGFFRFSYFNFRVINFRKLSMLLYLLVGFFVIGITSYELIAKFIERFLRMSVDDSALARLYSLKYGISILMDHPFGIGFNYLNLFLEDFSNLSMLDSSLLSILVTFGVSLFLFFLIVFFMWIIQAYSFAKNLQKNNFPIGTLFLGFYSYLIISIFFTSTFNNLLFFQFWLIPVLMMCTYFSIYKENIRKHSHFIYRSHSGN